jgi:hypothetical protein
LTRKRVSRLLLLLPFALLIPSAAKADTLRITEPTDLWFYYEQPTTFYARTFAVDGFWSDPMLWLYNQQGELLAANDDWFGLQSNLQFQVPAGWYRLRAGVCCGDPTRWYNGVAYDVSTTDTAIVPTTTTTTTIEQPTTTTPETTTTTVEISTSTVVDTTTTVLVPSTTTTEPATSVVDTTTTTVAYTTTTVQPSTTVVATTTSTTFVPSTTTTEMPVLPTTTVPLPQTTTTVAPTTTRQTTTTTSISTTTTTTVPDSTTTTTTTVLPAPETVEQLEQIVGQIEELSDTELTQLAETLSDAPAEIKKQFEAEVNVFSGKFDNYVPVDSKIPVGQRRALVAVTAASIASAGLSIRRK